MRTIRAWALPIALALAIALAIVVSVAALVAERDDWLTQSHPQAQGVLGPPIAILHPGIGGGWYGYPTQVRSHFYAKWASGARGRCGRPTGSEKRTAGGYRQVFSHCWMIEGAVRVHLLTRPHPTPTPLSAPFVVGPVGPTATPRPVVLPPTAPPAASTPEGYLLGLLNEERQRVGSAPLTLDPQLSSCALTHSKRMASEGAISHDGFPQPDLVGCITGWTTGGQNVGFAGSDEYAAIKLDFDQMLAEGHAPLGTCQDGHDCNITRRAFTRVGLGIYDNGQTWVTETFAG